MSGICSSTYFPRDEDREIILEECKILDTEPDEAFDRITALAARSLKFPIALVTLMDTKRHWFKSRLGLDFSEAPRSLSLCSYCFLSENAPIFIIPDTFQEPQFASSPLVTHFPFIRFYAGASLFINNVKIGVLCVIDQKPRHDFRFTQQQILMELAQCVTDLIQTRRRENLERKYHSVPLHQSVLRIIREPLTRVNESHDGIRNLCQSLLTAVTSSPLSDSSHSSCPSPLASSPRFMKKTKAAWLQPCMNNVNTDNHHRNSDYTDLITQLQALCHKFVADVQYLDTIVSAATNVLQQLLMTNMPSCVSVTHNYLHDNHDRNDLPMRSSISDMAGTNTSIFTTNSGSSKTGNDNDNKNNYIDINNHSVIVSNGFPHQRATVAVHAWWQSFQHIFSYVRGVHYQHHNYSHGHKYSRLQPVCHLPLAAHLHTYPDLLLLLTGALLGHVSLSHSITSVSVHHSSNNVHTMLDSNPSNSDDDNNNDNDGNIDNYTTDTTNYSTTTPTPTNSGERDMVMVDISYRDLREQPQASPSPSHTQQHQQQQQQQQHGMLRTLRHVLRSLAGDLTQLHASNTLRIQLPCMVSHPNDTHHHHHNSSRSDSISSAATPTAAAGKNSSDNCTISTCTNTTSSSINTSNASDTSTSNSDTDYDGELQMQMQHQQIQMQKRKKVKRSGTKTTRLLSTVLAAAAEDSSISISISSNSSDTTQEGAGEEEEEVDVVTSDADAAEEEDEEEQQLVVVVRDGIMMDVCDSDSIIMGHQAQMSNKRLKCRDFCGATTDEISLLASSVVPRFALSLNK